ncbi:hypothetical protein B0F90DRAFT_1736003 [Multifurca ochricompacta]|uniref:Uncharacterized protein n=1 Tax=Multifurca ochricompacta TaxID=376703 RepID=A0AAD4QKW6_9AGAM|nr:hypothetical protein B0F90DRAFT_1736003 [Multifurca ochricompacta]
MMQQGGYSQLQYSGTPQSSQPSGHPGSYAIYAQADPSFPEPNPHTQSAPLSQPAHYSTHPQPEFNLSTYSDQQQRHDPYGYAPSISRVSSSSAAAGGGGSGGHQIYATRGSISTGASSYASPEVESQSGRGHSVSSHQPQHWPAATDSSGDYQDSFRSKGPGDRPVAGHRESMHICRMPGCNRPVFFDRRVNERREWCSDQHMQTALRQGLEKSCKHCRVWPRRYSYRLCSGDSCKYPGYA